MDLRRGHMKIPMQNYLGVIEPDMQYLNLGTCQYRPVPVFYRNLQHYLRAYEKVGNVWKPTRNVCRFFHGEGAYKDAAQAKRKREDEAKARKVVARRSAREKKRRTTI